MVSAAVVSAKVATQRIDTTANAGVQARPITLFSSIRSWRWPQCTVQRLPIRHRHPEKLNGTGYRQLTKMRWRGDATSGDEYTLEPGCTRTYVMWILVSLVSHQPPG